MECPPLFRGHNAPERFDTVYGSPPWLRMSRRFFMSARYNCTS
jgi:hypothetical protein